ncbi:MAG: hypothetical protein WC869_15145 [Phycisphaerae bacterium]|jgi:hypothetical protein
MKTKITHALAAVASFATSALAAYDPMAKQFQAPALESKTPWLAILCAVVAVAAICAVAFKKSGRTHLD